MILAALSCATLAVFTVATPSRRGEDLAVQVIPSHRSINNLNDLDLAVSISNIGVESVQIFKYGTVLDNELPTQSFVVTKEGQHIDFTGIKISVSLDASNDSTAYVTIEPGQTLTLSHSLGSLYDFASTGVGQYTFEPITAFIFANQKERRDDGKRALRARTTSASVEVEITGGLDSPRQNHVDSRAVNICQDPAMNKAITDSFTESQILARTASTYIQTQGADPLYTSYFGSTPTNVVRGIFDAVANENSQTRTFNCVDIYGGCASDIRSYTHLATTNIIFCPPFFQTVSVDRLCQDTSAHARNLRGGTTLHELTHALARTQDLSYGCAFDMELGDQGVQNADTFNCFSAQIYANRCGGA